MQKPGLAAALLLCGALTGCAGLTDEQRTLLADGQLSFEKRQYPRAVEQLTRFVEDVPNRPETAQAFYLRGMSQALMNHRANAYADLDQAVRRADPASEAYWRAQAGLGTLYFEDERWADAARAYGEAVARMPQPPAAPMDAYLFRLGVSLERLGRWNDSRGPFGRLVNAFPTTVYGLAGKRRLQIAADSFAVQCGAFASQENAQNQVAELKRRGLSPYIRLDPRDRGALYVVLVGQYETYAEAIRELALVKSYVPNAVLWP